MGNAPAKKRDTTENGMFFFLVFFPTISTVSRGYRKCNDNLSIQLYIFLCVVVVVNN